ncbi:RdRP-domain-containing protein, partial [Dendrothele bispora CBS 962.96]
MANTHILKSNPTKDDDTWKFEVLPAVLTRRPRNSTGKFGKFIKFTSNEISLQIQKFPSNRILHLDHEDNFVLCSFGDFRLPDSNLRTNGEYIARFLKTGLFLNNVQYRFYHHSNSQLRGRSCFLRKATSDAELDSKIYELGDFEKIKNVAKRAKRIGLLFSEAQIDYVLDPKYISDIPDIKAGDEIFSDGCGLISKRLAVQVSRAKKIIFRGKGYTPCVFQIRYLGYKGVLMLHPELDQKKEHLAEFRQSMKKFSTTTNTTFSVVDYSKPYAFGRLNNDIIVLLNSLGVSNEKLLGKQASYLQRILEASTDPLKAIDLLSSMDQYPLAEKVLLDGLSDTNVQAALRRLQMKEIADFRNERNKQRSRMIIEKSRLLFGVCDPFKVLKEGEVYIRISTGYGATTPIHGDVLMVRNPCLYPGDCLKLRAVHHEKLIHLVDCIVFASVAKPGRHAAPSMSSGGDLDGDKFFVCWDPDLVPPIVAESYDYPPNKEKPNKAVTRADLANHFALYNNASLARIASLHSKWVRGSPKGAMCSECQELNALHSQSVDGASVKIPDRLTIPPEPSEPYILDLLADAAQKFADEFVQSEQARRSMISDPENLTGKYLLEQLLRSQRSTISEYELFSLAWRMSRKFDFDLTPLLGHFDFGAFTAQQKHAIIGTLQLPQEGYNFIWNSLFRSDILTRKDLYDRCLSHPFSIQRLYSSKLHGLQTFFEYLRMATEQFTRKILILKTDDRFSLGIFMRGDIPWDEDPIVNDNVVLCSFLPQTSATFSTYFPCTTGYRLHCSDVNLQLYDKHRGNTFVFITTPPKASGAEVVASIALQKFSARVQRQIGRINRTPITGIELHVISNRDRIAHQLFDLWFEHVPTEIRLKRFEREKVPYRVNDIADVDWDTHPGWLKDVFFIERRTRIGEFKLDPRSENDFIHQLEDKTPDQLDQVMEVALDYHLDNELFWAFSLTASQVPLRRDQIRRWMDSHPPLVFVLLRVFPPLEDPPSLPLETAPFTRNILENIIRSANTLGIASLVALEKISANIARLSSREYLDLLWLTASSVRSMQLVQEIMFVLNDCRATSNDQSAAARYER